MNVTWSIVSAENRQETWGAHARDDYTIKFFVFIIKEKNWWKLLETYINFHIINYSPYKISYWQVEATTLDSKVMGPIKRLARFY